MKKHANSRPTLRARRAMRAGFTLVELIIAGVLAAMVLAAVTFALSQLGKARNIARDRVEAYQRAATGLDAIRADISGVIRSDDLFDCRFLITSTNARSRGTDRRDQPRSELLIFNNSLRPVREISYQGEGLEYETAYRVEDDELGAALWRRRDPVPDDVPDGGGVAEPVADGIVGMRIEASDGQGSWQDEWDSDYDGMPKLVRISVTATGSPVGSDGTELTPDVTLQTMVAIDRMIAPKAEPSKDDAAPGAAAAADPNAAAAGGAQPRNGAVPGSGIDSAVVTPGAAGSPAFGGTRGGPGTRGGRGGIARPAGGGAPPGGAGAHGMGGQPH